MYSHIIKFGHYEITHLIFAFRWSNSHSFHSRSIHILLKLILIALIPIIQFNGAHGDFNQFLRHTQSFQRDYSFVCNYHYFFLRFSFQIVNKIKLGSLAFSSQFCVSISCICMLFFFNFFFLFKKIFCIAVFNPMTQTYAHQTRTIFFFFLSFKRSQTDTTIRINETIFFIIHLN